MAISLKQTMIQVGYQTLILRYLKKKSKNFDVLSSEIQLLKKYELLLEFLI